MMGNIGSGSQPVTKTTNAVLVLPEEHLIDAEKETEDVHRSETCGGKLLSVYNVYRPLSEKPPRSSDRAAFVHACRNMQKDIQEPNIFSEHILLLFLWSVELYSCFQGLYRER